MHARTPTPTAMAITQLMANYRIETDAADHASTFARTSASGKPFIACASETYIDPPPNAMNGWRRDRALKISVFDV